MVPERLRRTWSSGSSDGDVGLELERENSVDGLAAAPNAWSAWLPSGSLGLFAGEPRDGEVKSRPRGAGAAVARARARARRIGTGKRLPAPQADGPVLGERREGPLRGGAGPPDAAAPLERGAARPARVAA